MATVSFNMQLVFANPSGGLSSRNVRNTTQLFFKRNASVGVRCMAQQADPIKKGVFSLPDVSDSGLKPDLGAIGGKEVDSWDDGVFEGVRKIQVWQGDDGVSGVKFEYYNKDSDQPIIIGHGKETDDFLPDTFTLGSDEYLTAVEVYRDKIIIEEVPTTLVTSLVFKTNKNTSYPFGLTAGVCHEHKEEGRKIVGFKGRSGEVVYDIGVRFAPISKISPNE